MHLPSFKCLFLESTRSVKDILVDSIKHRYVIYFYYEGDDQISKGYRWVEPVCFGYSSKGKPLVRAFQLREDPSRSHHKPMWRLFRADKIHDISQSVKRFNRVRKGYNRGGDATMSRVLINSKFK